MQDFSVSTSAISMAAPLQGPTENWSLFERAAFRFGFLYLILYCWPSEGRVSILQAIPAGSKALANWAQAPSRALCPWVAVHVFHVSGPAARYHPTGSGDTTLDYVQVFCFVALAAIGALVWSVLDRRRPHYRTLYAWLRLLVRFTLAFTLLAYGFAKIFPLQFASPMLGRLTQAYGESSPMGLLWTFMGASPAYTKFSGLAEAGAGVLLLFRRTTVLGALAAAAVMLNVAMLNFCYDVPVKLYSSHLLLMSAFLLLPDASALWNFLILHRPSRLGGVWLPRFERRWLRNAAVVLQVLVVISVLSGNIWNGYQFSRREQPKQGDLYGAWNVDSYVSDRREGTGAADGLAWLRVVVGGTRGLRVTTAGGEAAGFQTTYDPSKHLVHLVQAQTKQTGDLTYSLPDPDHLVLRGSLNGKPLEAQAHRVNTKGFLLTSRGFHWISEDPFNR